MENKTQSFKKVCGRIHAASVVFLAIEIIFAVIYLLGATGIDTMWQGNIWETVPELIRTATMLIMFNYMRLIFGQLRGSETPFLPEVPRRMKAIAYTLIIGGGAYWTAGFAVLGALQYLAAIPRTVGVDVSAATVFGVLFVMFGCVIWGISYIFARGCELQRESDETL
ncbi:MAG: hypothetical protein NC395_06915 [Prevotella sp.]|nr:hypothetical protein [Prevotella sp.]